MTPFYTGASAKADWLPPSNDPRRLSETLSDPLTGFAEAHVRWGFSVPTADGVRGGSQDEPCDN